MHRIKISAIMDIDESLNFLALPTNSRYLECFWKFLMFLLSVVNTNNLFTICIILCWFLLAHQYNWIHCLFTVPSIHNLIGFLFFYITTTWKISNAKTRKLKQVESFAEPAQRLRKVFMKLKSISFSITLN